MSYVSKQLKIVFIILGIIALIIIGVVLGLWELGKALVGG